jgi:hypothetical protein
MRSIPVAMAALTVVFVSTMSTAQVLQLPRPAPDVTAANAEWQLRGDPVFFAGNVYHPAGPNVFFDGFAMVFSGTYQGIPLYTDTSIEPYSIVYVPIGRNAMRPYERRRAGELAGTAGSRTSSLPIERDAEWSRAEFPAGGATPAAQVERSDVPAAPRAVGTGGLVANTPGVGGMRAATPPDRPARLLVQSIPAPRSNAGIWLEFNGARWYSAGKAVPHIADKFVRIGSYRGWPVYRDTTRRNSEIYIPSVAGGPLAPFVRR